MLSERNASFRGGVHPTDGSDKALSKGGPIRYYKPDTVRLSMAQSGSGICEAIVKKGDRVQKGQLVGTPKNFTAVKLHASVSGVIEDIETVKQNNGDIQVLVIKADKEQPEVKKGDYSGKITDISNYQPEDIVTAFEEGGICGMGGAGFPTHVKFKSGKPIEYVLINASECESYLTCDYRMMLEYGYELINGAMLMKKAAGAGRVIICMEDNKTDCAQHLKELIKNAEDAPEIKILPTKYPQGGERQLIQAVCGKEVPRGGLPADAGVIVCNVQTAVAAADMVLAGEPSVTRCITITGGVKSPGNFMVPLGTPISELVDECGGITVSDNKVILGGPMTGTCIGTQMKENDIKNCVTKVSGGLIVLEDTHLTESACIRCGRCKEACPAGLTPWKIDFSVRNNDIADCEALFATECIACGSCSYECPAKRELAHYTAKARDAVKAAIRERGNKK